MAKSKSNHRDTAPIRAGEELDQRALEEWLRRKLTLPAETPLTIEQFPGGHSNLTYALRCGEVEMVLRRPPRGPVAPTAHDMPREYRLLRAISPWFPLAPRPLLLAEAESPLGVPFYLMERRHGIIIRNEVPEVIAGDRELPRKIGERLIDTLVELHGIDLDQSGLIALGKPAGFVPRQVDGWTRRWERARLDDLPAMDELAGWLPEKLPRDPERPALIHNDYKLDNVMLEAENPERVVALLDWEMATIGDPLIDLGLLLCYWPEANDPEIFASALPRVTTGPGWPKRDELITRYAARSGRPVDEIAWYHIFAIFKLAVIMQQIYFRYRAGQTSDARFADFGTRVAALAEWAASLSRR